MRLKNKWVGPRVLLLGMLGGCTSSGTSGLRGKQDAWKPWQCNEKVHTAPSCKSTGALGSNKWQQHPPDGTTCAKPNFQPSRSAAKTACKDLTSYQPLCRWDDNKGRCIK